MAAFKKTCAAALLLFGSTAVAQQGSEYAAGLLDALNGTAGLTMLTQLAASNAAELLPLLQQGNHTLFAPTDAALTQATSAGLLNGTTPIIDILKYHILEEPFDPENLTLSNSTVARTALNTTSLPGGTNQVVVFTGEKGAPDQARNTTGGAGTIQIVQALSNVNSAPAITYENLLIYPIDSVLTIPLNSTRSLQYTGNQQLLLVASSLGGQQLEDLDELTGVTLFAPLNDPVTSAYGALRGNDRTTVWQNHYLNGTVWYLNSSSSAINDTRISASGQPLNFQRGTESQNSDDNEDLSQLFINSGNVTARVVKANIPLANGVLHIIDQVLVNTAVDPAAASSAAAAAATTAAPTPTGSAPGGGSSAATGTNPAQTSTRTGAASSLSAGQGLTGIAAVLAGLIAFV